MDIICFHNPDEDNGYLSNWYPSSFTVDGVAFSSMEQFMMYRKAICFGDEAVAAQILSTSDVAKIKSLGRQVSNYDESMWNGIRQIVVYEGLLAKFSQNEELKGKLKATENAVLAECAVKDCIWGIGLSMKDPDRLNKAKWNGQNLLGYALMMVRERLQQDYSWEQRKLSEVAEIVGGGTPSTNIPEYWDGDIDWYAPAEINDQIYVDGSERKITKLGLEKSSAKILPADKTVLFTSRAGIGKTAILRRSGATNQGFQSMVLNDETNPYFVFSMSKFIKEEAERVASGSTFAEVSGKMLGNLAFMFPAKKEQDKIGEYFSNLDNLITLHQRELYKHLRYRILKVRRKS